MSFTFIAKGEEEEPKLSIAAPAGAAEEKLDRKEAEKTEKIGENYRLPTEFILPAINCNRPQGGSGMTFLVFNTSRRNTGSPTVRKGEGVVADDRQVATPRLSDRTDLDMVSQRRLRQEERAANRKHRLRAISDYNSFIVKQRGFQIRACHLLLMESQMFQSTQMRRGNESEVRREKPSLTGNATNAHRSPIGPPERRVPARVESSRKKDEEDRWTGPLPAKFSPRWYDTVHDDISLLLFDTERDYCATVRQQLAELYLFL